MDDIDYERWRGHIDQKINQIDERISFMMSNILILKNEIDANNKWRYTVIGGLAVIVSISSVVMSLLIKHIFP